MKGSCSPLYVDLDNSLLRTDVLWELAAQLIWRKPRKIPALLWRCLGSRPQLKAWLIREVDIPVELLPVNDAVAELIRTHRGACGPVFLATATHEELARRIAEHLGFFDGVLATTDACNLKGDAKLLAIRAHCEALGASGFGYVGDSRVDLPIWREAKEAWVVSRGPGAPRFPVPHLKVLPQGPVKARSAWMRLLRPRQWAKNALLFLPLVLAHRMGDPRLVVVSALAFASFSLAASGVYVFNDCSDVFRDRAHPRKRSRPLAAGDIPLWQAPLISAALLVAAGLLGCLGAGMGFGGVLLLYLASNLLYTSWLKHFPMVDAVGLALMYTLRIFAGGIATGLEVSKWLLIFSMFFFLSLAFGKRYQEIAPTVEAPQAARKVRGYLTCDLPFIGIGGMSSGFISVMVLALYVQSPEVLRLYHAPVFLWLLCPLAVYWIGRFWIKTGRGQLHDDPVVFALNDRVSWIIGILMVWVLAAANFFPLR